jgi:gentisate 1,2-dioxygenase
LAFDGAGRTIINGQQFDWAAGDIFVVPSRAWHEHINDSPDERAILFSIQDTPLLKMVGKFREEAYGQGRQAVERVFGVS